MNKSFVWTIAAVVVGLFLWETFGGRIAGKLGV